MPDNPFGMDSNPAAMSPDPTSFKTDTPSPIVSPVDQPMSVLLDPMKPLHGRILGRLLARMRLSQRHMSGRYDDWDRVDEHCRLFIDMSRLARRADKTDDTTKKEMPFDRAIVIPMALAILQVRLAQLFGLFAYREPAIEVDGRADDDVKPAQAMEAVLAYDFEQTAGLQVLYAMLQDAEKYGMGVIYDSWEVESGWKKQPPPPPQDPMMAMIQSQLIQGGMMPPPQPVKTWAVVREFNRLHCVDPYNFWPDPRVPVSDVQNGEFAGHRVFRGFMHLFERSEQNGGPYFNLDKLKGGTGGGGLAGSMFTDAGTYPPRQQGAQRNRFNLDQYTLKESSDEKDKGFFALDHLQVKIIPREWELGQGDMPEIWTFTLADANTIIRAHASTYEHGRLCYSVAEPNHDPHAIYNQGTVENMDGSQRVVNWLANSHIENARKALNDQLIYSPTLIEESDLLNPGPARHIRLTRKAEELLLNGQMTMDQVAKQLEFVDVTQQHLKTIQFIFDMTQRLTAANDPTMGQPTEEKRTLGEVQSIIAAASQRVGVTARLMDQMAIRPLARRMIANRQQFTSLQQFYRITGDLMQELGGQSRLLVDNGELQGDLDYIPISGATPADPARQAELWTRIVEMVSQNQLLQQPNAEGQVIDVQKCFEEMVRNSGVKNLQQFYRQLPPPQPPAVLPDGSVQQGVQAGNMIPANSPEAMAGQQGGRIPGAGIQTPMVNVPNMPPTAPN